MEVLTTDEIDKAYERIQSLIIKTPLISNERINNDTNNTVTTDNINDFRCITDKT